MESYRHFLTSVIVSTLIIQIGTMILNKTRFEEMFKSISGIIFVIFIITSLSSCTTNADLNYTREDYTLNLDNNEPALISAFKENLKLMIEDDLHNTFYVNVSVDIKTDLKTIKIYIHLNDKNLENEIKNYIKQKYCTQHDEVIIDNENTN